MRKTSLWYDMLLHVKIDKHNKPNNFPKIQSIKPELDVRALNMLKYSKDLIFNFMI